MGLYDDVFRRSLEDPEGFWGEAARGIDWYESPKLILDDANPPFYRWFPGGVLNTCYNALDRHVASGRGDQKALIYDSPVTGAEAAADVHATTRLLLRDYVRSYAGAPARTDVTT